MGNIKSFCCRDTDSNADDHDERARILNDDSGNVCDNLYHDSASVISNQDSTSYGSLNYGNKNRTYEQSALDRIYQKMANNVIDVAPGESMVIQPAEFIERQRAYQSKLSQIRTPLPFRSASRMSKHLNNNSIDTNTINQSNHLRFPAALASINAVHSTSATSNSNSHTSNLTNHINPNVSNNSIQNLNKNQEKRGVDYEPISQDDIQLIKEISTKSGQAIKNLKIKSQEQVVTYFQP